MSVELLSSLFFASNMIIIFRNFGIRRNFVEIIKTHWLSKPSAICWNSAKFLEFNLPKKKEDGFPEGGGESLTYPFQIFHLSMHTEKYQCRTREDAERGNEQRQFPDPRTTAHPSRPFDAPFLGCVPRIRSSDAHQPLEPGNALTNEVSLSIVARRKFCRI